MTRMNILVAVLCLVMGRPYQFYYFVPLVSFWFVVIYLFVAAWPRVTAAFVKGEKSVFRSGIGSEENWCNAHTFFSTELTFSSCAN